MKAIIFNIKRFAVNDGPGIRTSIFFKGCPLNCLWCHNPESQSREIQKIKKTYKISDRVFEEIEDLGYSISSEELMKEILKDEIFFKESNGGVTFSGGEALMQADFLKNILKKSKENNIHTCLDTCGYVDSEILKEVAEYTDLFLYDIKHLDNSLHKEYTGRGNALILKNLSLLVDMNKEIILRFPLIEGMNDSMEHLKKLKNLIKSFNKKIELNILPYHSLGKEKYNNLGITNTLYTMPNMERCKAEKVAEYFKKNDIHTIIT